MKTTRHRVVTLQAILLIAIPLPSTSGSQRTDIHKLGGESDLEVLMQSTERNTTETKHVVFVHGAFHGAWCWYKVSNLLRNRGYIVAALDMTSHGINKAIADNVTSIAEYVQPAIDYLDTVTGKVVVVGHSLGGGPISYLMEKIGPEKISKAVFLAAVMPKNNRTSDEIDPPVLGIPPVPPDVFLLHYGNGLDNPPTSVSFNQSYGRQRFYGVSPEEDVVLANTLLVPTPVAVSRETLHLTPERYGKIRRFYVMTDRDMSASIRLQEAIIAQNPPERVFRLKNSDHSAFFSVPLALTKVIQNIDLL